MSTPDVGRLRRLQRICDRDGLVRTAAIDHPETYDLLFDSDLSAVSFEEVVESKLELVSAMSSHVSSLLLDPRTSFGQSVVTGAAPGNVGIISGIENLYFSPADGGFDPKLELKPGWGPERLAALGADAAKLVVFHRAVDEASLADKVALVTDAAERCHAVHLPLIIEPLWYPVAGEDPKSPEVLAQRTASVVATTAAFKAAGADVMKVEFPVDLASQADEADEACGRLAEACDGPWVLLSAGVPFDGFIDQVRVAVRHGCSGFMAGRAIWGDGVGRHDAERRGQGARVACERLDRLTEVLHSQPNPAFTPARQSDAPALVGPDWYRSSS